MSIFGDFRKVANSAKIKPARKIPDIHFSYLGQENPTRTPMLGNLIRNGLSGTVDCWHCLMTLLFMTSQRIPLHYQRRHRHFQWRWMLNTLWSRVIGCHIPVSATPRLGFVTSYHPRPRFVTLEPILVVDSISTVSPRWQLINYSNCYCLLYLSYKLFIRNY